MDGLRKKMGMVVEGRGSRNPWEEKGEDRLVFGRKWVMEMGKGVGYG